jgi:iron complex transport system substrate-binding protein
MKTKIRFVEIALVLCLVLLVALPAIGAEHTMQEISASTLSTASEDDYILEIYGNANEDDTIDMRDLTYVKLIFFGKKPETELADAKYDGKINPLDFIQIKRIIVGKEKELTLLDSADRIVTIKKPLKRLIPTYPQAIETLRSIKVPEDVIVGLGTWPTPLDPVFFAEFIDVPCIGTGWNPDVEAILELNPDAVILTALSAVQDVTPVVDVLESAGITVLRFKLQTPEIYHEEVEKLGYIFEKEKAEEYLDWREGILNSIIDTVEKIPEEDSPKVYFAPAFNDGVYYIYGRYAYIDMAGGKDIFADYPGKYMSVDPEAVMGRDPDIIVRVAPWTAGGYGLDADDTTEMKALREEILSQPELQKVKAVNDERVYIIADHFVSFFPASGCRQFVQIAYQAKWFHPELFEDLDPKAIHQEYLTRFQGLDIDLDEKGIFAYPEPS